eukprot:NODE_116_length_18347_cov_2.280962.p13 type:complete len:192 gc:universal NODE_116_length_18347_cov_2.280962:2650-3225(+)
MRVTDGVQYFLSAYCIFVTIGSICLFANELYIFYLTNITFISLTIYMTLYRVLPPRLANYMYSTLLTLHIIVPGVFWLFLRDTINMNSRLSLAWNVMLHGTDLIVIFIHFLITDNELPMISILWNLGTSMLYLSWAWFCYFLTHKFVYPFVDLNNSLAKFLYPGLFILVGLISLMWCKIHKWRRNRNKLPK